ncbi:MAG TPA: nuclear transport factor 2 family protein [Acetobacteraceae bacterium]|nr:nuclear transport factor 2 family protein [Acetobacteraceae bacterium]
MAHADDTTQSRNKAAVQASFDAWAAGTGSPYDLLAEDVVWTIVGHSVASKTYPSREAFLTEVIRPFNARMSIGLKPTIRHIYTDGDTVIVFFDARGTVRDGKPYVNTYAWFLGMRDGKIVEASAFFDSIVFNDFWSRVQPYLAK